MTSRYRTPRRVVALPDLSVHELEAWHMVHETVPAYDSPYFHPGFATAVHETGHPVSVVVLGQQGRAPTALLPFHRRRTRMRPLGSPGADFQGPLVVPGSAFAPRDLLGGNLRSFEFDHLLDASNSFDRWITVRRVSPYIDTSGGLNDYLGRASKSGKQNMSQARRRTAKAEREYGPIRFEVDVVDDKLLDQVIDLKRGQYAATGVRDYFADTRHIALARRIMHTRDARFGGVLSAVYAGDHLLAAHFGIRAGGVLHWWFPVYDPSFSSLAPGWILLRELVSAAPELGVHRIDLGRGEDNYKRWAKTGESTVCEGFLSSSSIRVAARGAKARLIDAAKDSSLGPKLRQVARKTRTRGRRPAD